MPELNALIALLQERKAAFPQLQVVLVTATPDPSWCAALGTGPQIVSAPVDRVLTPNLATEPRRKAVQMRDPYQPWTAIEQIEDYGHEWPDDFAVIVFVPGPGDALALVKLLHVVLRAKGERKLNNKSLQKTWL